MLRAYVRVSTPGQDLVKQKCRINMICSNYAKIIYYEDECTGTSTNRPGFFKMINELESYDVVVVTDLTRLTRSVKDGLTIRILFRSLKIILIVLDSETDEDMLSEENLQKFTKILEKSEDEIRESSKRVSAAMQGMSQTGTLRSRPPFGFKFAGKGNDYVPVPEQIEVINKILKLHASGIKMSPIAKKLNDDGDNRTLNLNKKSPKENPKFHAQQIKRILQMTPETLEQRIRPYQGKITERGPGKTMISPRDDESTATEMSENE